MWSRAARRLQACCVLACLVGAGGLRAGTPLRPRAPPQAAGEPGSGSVAQLAASLTDLAAKEPLSAQAWGWGGDAQLGAQVGAVSLGASNGWCLTGAELLELRELRAALAPCLDHLTAAEQRRVLTALDVAYQAQGCCSAEPRDAVGIARAVGLAELLARLRMDAGAIVSALLHGAVLSAELSLADAQTLAGRDGALLGQVLKVSSTLQLLRSSGLAHGASGAHAERTRRLVLALCPDARAVFVLLATAVLELREAKALPPPQREALAREALQLLAPLAHRLNIWSLKAELEALCFELLRPAESAALHNELGRLRTDCSPSLGYQRARLAAALAADAWLNGSTSSIAVSARLKEPFSVWQKLQGARAARGRAGGGGGEPGALASLADVLGLRVVFEPKAEAGQTAAEVAALELAIAQRIVRVTHGVWAPVSGRLKDYIRAPKENGYRSLHTTVVWGSLQAEVQVRSAQMHLQSQFGSAAHWVYKPHASRLLPAAQPRASADAARAPGGGLGGGAQPGAWEEGEERTDAAGSATRRAVVAACEQVAAGAAEGGDGGAGGSSEDASVWLAAAAECLAEEEQRAAAATAARALAARLGAAAEAAACAEQQRSAGPAQAAQPAPVAPRKPAQLTAADAADAALPEADGLERTARLVASVRRAVLDKGVLVATERGQVLALPMGASVGDAARMMQWIGDGASPSQPSLCASVNGRLVPLRTKLRTGDVLAMHFDGPQAATSTRLAGGSAVRPRGPAHGWAFVRDEESAAALDAGGEARIAAAALLGESRVESDRAAELAGAAVLGRASGIVRGGSLEELARRADGRARGPSALAAADQVRLRLEESVAQVVRAATTPSKWGLTSELKHGRIALLACAHIVLRAALGGAGSDLDFAASSTNAAAFVMTDLSFSHLPSSVVSLVMAAESAASHAVGGARDVAPWTGWCVLLAGCGLTEGFSLSRHDFEAPAREPGAGSVSARLAALRAADRGPAAPPPTRRSTPHADPLPAAGAEAVATDVATGAVPRPSAAEFERAAGRLAMVYLASLAFAIGEVLSRT